MMIFYGTKMALIARGITMENENLRLKY
jgi:hypothetical protein